MLLCSQPRRQAYDLCKKLGKKSRVKILLFITKQSKQALINTNNELSRRDRLLLKTKQLKMQ